jgi:prepilin signal peptidase PulO-like enzyme (type II secretory pathway)
MNELLYSFSYLWIIFFGLFGLVLGSFLNSWIWRSQHENSINSQRSICIHCQRQLTWYENIPLFSFIFLQGKCRTCKKPIPWHYPLVEGIMMLSFLILSWYGISHHFSIIHLLRDLIFIYILIAIFVSDGLYRLIPTSLLIMGSITGFIINYFFLSYSLPSLLLAAGIAGGFFLIQYLLSKGTWIGSGDIIMGVMMGLWLGWPNILIALFIAYITGASIGIIILLSKQKKTDTQIAFGTFLAFGTVISLYAGTFIISWYLHFLF